MFRWISITPVYSADGEILEYNIAVDAQNDQRESAYGQITVKPEDLDLSEINRVSKAKLIEMLTEEQA
nr:MAG TPA: Endo-beta-N-acetylglucosaminidase LytB WW domain [Caudoviricetes sp.]